MILSQAVRGQSLGQKCSKLEDRVPNAMGVSGGIQGAEFPEKGVFGANCQNLAILPPKRSLMGPFLTDPFLTWLSHAGLGFRPKRGLKAPFWPVSPKMAHFGERLKIRLTMVDFWPILAKIGVNFWAKIGPKWWANFGRFLAKSAKIGAIGLP